MTWLPDSLADNTPGELPPFRIKQSLPETRTISLHIAEEVRSGTLDKGMKVPVRRILRACHPSQALDTHRENSLLLFQLIQPLAHPTPQTGDGNMNLSNSSMDWLFLRKQSNSLGCTVAHLHVCINYVLWSYLIFLLFLYRSPAIHGSSLGQQ